ncbi:hypothetical protein [Noviherbaspirillum galbum]|uniref:Uncharacterized protein n=1 Tax=Noviherbaspirillum galbum TaxID=2709383 RepID=A0A6B3SJH3_9BURK|nr:hypothetical protein [Noviherbaspirillum galbum]NEX61004.1 hypothetical protein [Noviherbaspirillum galbum]
MQTATPVSMPDAVREMLRDVAKKVDEAIRLAPGEQVKSRFGDALDAAIAARNRLIALARDVDGDEKAAACLPAVNALLSMMSSIEYPLEGLHLQRMQTVRQELQRLAA